MVYNNDPSRAFDTEVSAYRSCSSSWAAAGLSSLLGAYQRKPGPAAAPFSCGVPPLCALHGGGTNAVRRQETQNLTWRAPYAPGKAASPSALPTLMTFSRHMR